MRTLSKQHSLLIGFSAVELLVVVALLSVLTAVSASTFVAIKRSQELKVASQDVWLMLRSARNATLASDTDRAYGVHVDTGRIVQFVAPTYSSSTASNVISSFPESIVASSSFGGGGSDILFARLSGEASATGTITLTHSATGATSSITVAKSGLIDTIR